MPIEDDTGRCLKLESYTTPSDPRTRVKRRADEMSGTVGSGSGGGGGGGMDGVSLPTLFAFRSYFWTV